MSRIPVSEQVGCRDCGAPVPGKKHRYCTDCAKRREGEAQERYRARHPERIRQRSRNRWQKVNGDPELRQKKREQQRRHYAKNREYWSLRNHHGMIPDELARMWEAQDGGCYLCKRPLDIDKAVIDHDHRCCGPNRSCWYCRRGLTHALCNTLIGEAGDDPELLRRIAASLEAKLAEVSMRMDGKPQQLTLLDAS